MAVMLEKTGYYPGGEVESFLASRPALHARMPEILAQAHNAFQEDQIRLSVECDPEVEDWRYLLLEIVTNRPWGEAAERQAHFDDDYLLSVLHEFPLDLTVVTTLE